MGEWRKKTLSELQKHGFSPISLSKIQRGDDNTVMQAECDSDDLIVKWFTDNSQPRIPRVGTPRDRFIGGWYVQDRLSSRLDVNIPEILFSEFKGDNMYYVMREVRDENDNELWFKDTYLLRICREIGSMLSQVHGISESALGGIPGKQTDPMINMRRLLKEIENNIADTPYMAYSESLEGLSQRYEGLYNPRNTPLIHGRPSVGNILTDDEGVVTGLIDWDESMYADPLLDIAFFQAYVCDVFGIFSPWDIDTLREAVEESYSHAINAERLEILRVLIHLNAAARAHNGALHKPWRKVEKKSEETRQEIHRERFENQIEEIDIPDI